MALYLGLNLEKMWVVEMLTVVGHVRRTLVLARFAVTYLNALKGLMYPKVHGMEKRASCMRDVERRTVVEERAFGRHARR
jgi:hypothetical protein